jgi:hypothetical protein
MNLPKLFTYALTAGFAFLGIYLAVGAYMEMQKDNYELVKDIGPQGMDRR